MKGKGFLMVILLFLAGIIFNACGSGGGDGGEETTIYTFRGFLINDLLRVQLNITDQEITYQNFLEPEKGTFTFTQKGNFYYYTNPDNGLEFPFLWQDNQILVGLAGDTVQEGDTVYFHFLALKETGQDYGDKIAGEYNWVGIKYEGSLSNKSVNYGSAVVDPSQKTITVTYGNTTVSFPFQFNPDYKAVEIEFQGDNTIGYQYYLDNQISIGWQMVPNQESSYVIGFKKQTNPPQYISSDPNFKYYCLAEDGSTGYAQFYEGQNQETSLELELGNPIWYGAIDDKFGDGTFTYYSFVHGIYLPQKALALVNTDKSQIDIPYFVVCIAP